MKILTITNYYPPEELGGWEQLTRDVNQSLIERGHQIYTLTSNYRAARVEDTPDVKRALHLESPDHVHYRISYTLLHKYWERQNNELLTKTVSWLKPDIIFINGMWNLPVSLAKKAEELLPGRVVYYLASYWPTELDAHTAYWRDLPAFGWKRIFKQILGFLIQKAWLESTPRNRLSFHRVLCVSEFVRDYLINEAGVPEERASVVYNGIELDLFRNFNTGNGASPLKLVYAGQIGRDKGVHTIIESLAYLRSREPDLHLMLSIYGSGSPEYENYLKGLVEEHGIQEEVQFCGRVPREQMPVILRNNDVLLFPSIWPEPLARIVQEAMASGMVVIGTNTGGTPEILADGVNGLQFEADNAVMLAEKISLLARHPHLRRKLAIAARQTVEERFSLERMVNEIEESFYAVLAEQEYVAA